MRKGPIKLPTLVSAELSKKALGWTIFKVLNDDTNGSEKKMSSNPVITNS